MTLDTGLMQGPAFTVVAAISREGGLEHFCIYRDSVNADKFNDFLTGLCAKVPSASGTIFLDNLRVHHSHKVSDHLAFLGLPAIFNVPYAPELNAIELFWAMVKRRFKTLRLSELTRGVAPRTRELIFKAMTQIEASRAMHVCARVIEKYY